MAKRGLGKGLGALLPVNLNLDIGDKRESGQITELKIEQILPNRDQPRKQMAEDRLGELAASIQEHGIVQPIVVRQLEGGNYQIVAGERRWRACLQLHMDSIPAIIKDYNEQEALEIALIENIQREDLNPLEEARAYKLLIEEHDLTQEALSARVGKSRSFIANMLRLLNLARPVQEMLIDGEISIGHGRALLSLPENGQVTLARRILRESLSVRETEGLIKGILTLAAEKPKKTLRPELPRGLEKSLALDYQERLQERLGTKVEINQQGEKGKIVIEYYSPDDLNRVLEFFFEEKI